MTAHNVMAFIAGFVVASLLSINLARGSFTRGYCKAIDDLMMHNRTNPDRVSRSAVFPFMAEFFRRAQRGDFRGDA